MFFILPTIFVPKWGIIKNINFDANITKMIKIKNQKCLGQEFKHLMSNPCRTLNVISYIPTKIMLHT